ncbi:MAG: hypothetical protein JRG76_03875 [Deltaproteobacteria bacterium]|nr:hypothetical protein [Deltaproteobacteria bacterium]MBW2413628.1 hypothetical protein [Deltaproteobacteria bacterium]
MSDRPPPGANTTDTDSAGVYDGLSADALGYGDLPRAAPPRQAAPRPSSVRGWLVLAAVIAVLAAATWLLARGSA